MRTATQKHLTHAWAHALAGTLAIRTACEHLAVLPGPPTPAHAPLAQALALVEYATMQLAAVLDVALPAVPPA